MTHRRTILQVCGAGILSTLTGCASLLSHPSENSPDIIVVNYHQSPVTVVVTVTDATGDLVVARRLDVPVAKGHGHPNAQIEDVFETDGLYTISIEVEGGLSATQELEIRTTATDADMHQIYLHTDEIVFS